MSPGEIIVVMTSGRDDKKENIVSAMIEIIAPARR
jgi:hypothetical protein